LDLASGTTGDRTRAGTGAIGEAVADALLAEGADVTGTLAAERETDGALATLSTFGCLTFATLAPTFCNIRRTSSVHFR